MINNQFTILACRQAGIYNDQLSNFENLVIENSMKIVN